MENTIDQELAYYFKQLNTEEKNSFLQLIKTFLTSRKDIRTTTIEEYNQELLEGEAEYERGEHISHDELLKQIKEW